MASPANNPATSDPQSWSDYKPESTSDEIAVENLANARHHKTQYRCYTCIAHRYLLSWISLLMKWIAG